MIRFEKVTKRFGDKTVLDELDIDIPKGKITFIVGKSGEGKSVTIKHIMGLLKPTSGRIFIDGDDFTSFSQDQVLECRKSFGMLFQHAALFDSMTVEDNVMFPLREHTKLNYKDMLEQVNTILVKVGLDGLNDKFPSELSTGEKKRVGLARALVSDPKIILYDEPTTGMDPLVSEMIDELIVKVNQEEAGLTSIVISHDLKAALDTAENIVMLYKGKVQLAGTPEDFKHTKDPVIRQFFAGKTEGPMEFM